MNDLFLAEENLLAKEIGKQILHYVKGEYRQLAHNYRDKAVIALEKIKLTQNDEDLDDFQMVDEIVTI